MVEYDVVFPICVVPSALIIMEFVLTIDAPLVAFESLCAHGTASQVYATVCISWILVLDTLRLSHLPARMLANMPTNSGGCGTLLQTGGTGG